jgi:hypothetical protein
MVAVSTPVSAQRWHEIVNNAHIEGKLDMESLRWDGSVVTYQVVYQKPRPGSDEKRTSLATSEMNCETHQRRLITSQSPYPNGTIQEAGGLAIWRPIDAGTMTSRIEQLICGKRP